MIRNEFYFERVSSENLEDLVYLMSSVNNRNVDLEFFQSKFNTDYSGKEFIGYFAYSQDGEPAAFYGVFPVLMRTSNRTFIAAQSGDTVTNPKYQKRGLFTMLAEMTYDLAKKEGIELVFGFPNENSAHGFFNKLNWNKVGSFYYFIFQNSTSNLYNLLHKFKITNPLYKLYLKLIFPFIRARTDIFSNSNIDNDNVVVFYTADFINYKKYNQSFCIKLNDFALWIKFDDGITVGKIMTKRLYTINDIEKISKKISWIFGTKKVTFQIFNPSKQFEILNESKESFKGLDAGVLILNPELNKNSFHFSFSDLDTF